MSAGRHAVDGASLARGAHNKTLQQSRRRQQVPREEVPRELTQSDDTFILDINMLTENLKCARRGAAGGPIRDDSGAFEASLGQLPRHRTVLSSRGSIWHRARFPEMCLKLSAWVA